MTDSLPPEERVRLGLDLLAEWCRRDGSWRDTMLAAGEAIVRRQRRERFATRSETAPHFNLFRILGIDRREVRTHSAMLGHLLDPGGFHGQGGLFLERFLAIIDEKAPELRLVSAADGIWSADLEWAFQVMGDDGSAVTGRVDILLRQDGRPICAIENKIDAQDQNLQCTRYWRYLRRHRPEQARWPVVYLTIDGHAPAEAMAADVGRDVVRVSYRTDVAPLLHGLLPEIGSPSVRSIVEHYASLVAEI